MAPPFGEQQREICEDLKDLGTDASLPGKPTMKLNDAKGLAQYLHEELYSTKLEGFAHHLWLMANTEIRSLHTQKVMGREIVLTEKAGLHMVWYRNRIFVKPLPAYLLSHKFWTQYLESDADMQRREKTERAARGLLRSYKFLIQHESDFGIAIGEDLRLLPRDLTWDKFDHFLSELSKIEDTDVTERYEFVELRLARLNLWIKVFQLEQNYMDVHHTYTDYFADIYGPLLFIFATLTIILNGIQVSLAAVNENEWMALWSTPRYIGIVVILVTVGVASFFMLMWVTMCLQQWRPRLQARWASKWRPDIRAVWYGWSRMRETRGSAYTVEVQ